MQKGKKNILIIGYLPPPHEGTAMIGQIINNSKILKDQFEVSYLKLAVVKNSGDRGKFAIRNVLINMFNIIRFLRQMFIFNPAMVYMNLAQNKFGFLRDSCFILISKLFGKKIVVHFQGGNFDNFYLTSSLKYRKYIKYVLNKVDTLILLAAGFKNQFNGLIKGDNMEVVQNPFPGITVSAITRSCKSGNLIKIFYIGYISRAKGAVDLVRSIPLVKDKYENIIVNMVGQRIDIEKNISFVSDPDNAYMKIMDIIESNGIKDSVNLLGSISEYEKEKHFMDSDIFVLPSYSEGCPVAILEAMAYSLPIITTPVGALPEMLVEDKNCLYVEPGDYKAIAEKILFLVNNPEKRNEMGANNRELVANKYNTDMFCNKLSYIWNNVLMQP